MDSKKSVFVIMPFSKTDKHTEEYWTEIYNDVFKTAIEACGYSCERARPATGSLIKTIIEKLRNSTIVLADITDRNPNVLYELGVRHSLSKRTIIVSQSPDDIPSDLKGYWSVIYGTFPAQVNQFKAEIKRIISEIENDPDKSDSPISDYLEHEALRRFYFNNDAYYKYGAQARRYNQLLQEQDRDFLLFKYEKTIERLSDNNLEEWHNRKRSFIKEEICQGYWLKIADRQEPNYSRPPDYWGHFLVQFYPDGKLIESEFFNTFNKAYGCWELVGPVLRMKVHADDTYELDIFASRNINIHLGIEIREDNPKEPNAYFKIIHIPE